MVVHACEHNLSFVNSALTLYKRIDRATVYVTFKFGGYFVRYVSSFRAPVPIHVVNVRPKFSHYGHSFGRPLKNQLIYHFFGYNTFGTFFLIEFLV